MEKKITKRTVINAMLTEDVVKANPMYVDYLMHELELMDNRGESKADKEKKAEDEKLVNAMFEGMSNGVKGTATDIAKAIPALNGLSNQKVTALLKVLMAEGTVIRVKDGKRVEFSLAPDCMD